MNKLLLNTISAAFLLVINMGYSQSGNFIDSFILEQENILSSNSNPFVKQDAMLFGKEVFSYTFDIDTSKDHFDHEHGHEVSLLDVITLDEGADFNCSGGFCMNKSHSHKKGLSLKKQFFDYFMSITC